MTPKIDHWLFFKLYGHQVLESSNGLEAKKIFDERKNDISLVISDMIMPRMSGQELSEKIRISKSNVKILLISGYTDNHISNNELLVEGINYLQKPFSGKEMMIKVREILDK